MTRQYKVSLLTISNTEKENLSERRVKDPVEIFREREHPTGPGSICLRDIDAAVLLILYHQEPSTTLRGYVNCSYSHTGTLLCGQTIANFFDHGFGVQGSFCKPNLVL